MNINNANLRPYFQKVEQILGMLTDPTVSLAVRKTRISDAKANLHKIADHLIKAKEQSQDLVFKGEIDYIVNTALQGYGKAAQEILAADVSPLPEPTMSESAKMIAELNADDSCAACPAATQSTTDTFADALNQVLAQNNAPAAPSVPQAPESAEFYNEAPVARTPETTQRHFAPGDHPAPQSTGEIMIPGWTETSGEGFFVFSQKGPMFLKDTDELKNYLTDFVGKKLPLIIKGSRIVPKLQVTVDIGGGTSEGN